MFILDFICTKKKDGNVRESEEKKLCEQIYDLNISDFPDGCFLASERDSRERKLKMARTQKEASEVVSTRLSD